MGADSLGNGIGTLVRVGQIRQDNRTRALFRLDQIQRFARGPAPVTRTPCFPAAMS
ncbi:hypothetical protein SAMN05443573_102122 [Celeribacter indicus]|nr:hypothetical protein SAMN05443573_102122 [Celeribacter indicus]